MGKGTGQEVELRRGGGGQEAGLNPATLTCCAGEGGLETEDRA